MAKPILGRGLSALLGGASASAQSAAKGLSTPAAPTSLPVGEFIQSIAVAKVHPSSLQPRKDFAADALAELADSIREKGIVQPLIVRPQGDHFELIAGERRWRAAQIAGLAEIPVIVRTADDRTVLELALIENLQRENLNAVEEALGYAQLIEQFSLTQEEAAVKVGKSRALVANALRLLKLSAELQSYLREGRLSVGHAKVILGLSSPAEQKLAAERVLKSSLNVRQTEDLVASLQDRTGPKPGAKTKSVATADAHIASLESRLRERFGTKVALRFRDGKGAVEIKFFSDDDFERFLKLAGIELD
jgi:ParB family transcriptional regulator, chromosome partitioning protein